MAMPGEQRVSFFRTRIRWRGGAVVQTMGDDEQEAYRTVLERFTKQCTIDCEGDPSLPKVTSRASFFEVRCTVPQCFVVH